MTISEPSFPYLTWDCAGELEGRLKKTLYHGGKSDCMAAISSAALADLAVSVYIAAAPSPKRKLQPGYISSISKRLAVNPCTMMLGILYCERMRQINPDYLTKISSSDLFVVSLIVASKFLNDEGEDDEIFNDEWAVAGGLAVSTVNRLELEFLNAMKWRAYVNPKEFLQFCSKLETSIALKHGLDRGWFSYTDLTNLLAHIHFSVALRGFVHKVFQIMVGCTLAYGLSISFLLSAILCISATLKADPVTNGCGYVSDNVHPFSHRKITRTRQNIPATYAECSDAHQVPCNCDVSASVNSNSGRGEYSCRCLELAKNRSVALGCARYHSLNCSKVMHDFLGKGNSYTTKEKAESSRQLWEIPQNELKPDKEVERLDLFRIPGPDDTHIKNCKPSNRLLFEGLLSIVRRKNANITKKVIYHETFFPLGKFPTIGHGLFFNKGI